MPLILEVWRYKLPKVFSDQYLSISWETTLKWMQRDLTDDTSTISSGDDLVPSGNKSLPDPMLT